MSRSLMFLLFFAAVFLQAGAYGLTFLLPDLFGEFGADEKVVGQMLFVTTLSTLVAVYFAGHLSDILGRLTTLGFACLLIALALALYGGADQVGFGLLVASSALGIGWGLTYSLCPVVLTRLVAPEERVQFFALLSVFVMAGFGLSPVMTSAMSNAGFGVPEAFYLTSGLCAVSAALFFTLSAPVRRLSGAGAVEARSRLTLAAIGEILKSPARLPVVMVWIGASVFAGVTNFQTVMADERGLAYSGYFLAYTLTVVVFRLVLVRFSGGRFPYLTIAGLQYTMFASIILFLTLGSHQILYLLFAVLFGIGYGVSYPILVAMAANDAEMELVPQTLQLFALTYFVGVFGFPLIAGWMIVEFGSTALLILTSVLALAEASLALRRGLSRFRAGNPA